MAKFTHDVKAFEAEVLCSGEMAADMGGRARKIMAAAIANAPVGTEARDNDKPRYIESFYSEVEIKHTGVRPGNRAVGIVGNTVPYAGDIEFGNGNRVGRAPLRRAMYEAGG